MLFLIFVIYLKIAYLFIVISSKHFNHSFYIFVYLYYKFYLYCLVGKWHNRLYLRKVILWTNFRKATLCISINWYLWYRLQSKTWVQYKLKKTFQIFIGVRMSTKSLDNKLGKRYSSNLLSLFALSVSTFLCVSFK